MEGMDRWDVVGLERFAVGDRWGMQMGLGVRAYLVDKCLTT